MIRRWLLSLLLPALAWTDPVPVTVSGTGFEIGELKENAEAFLNRDYVWQDVTPELRGWQFTRIDGGTHPLLAATPLRDGHLYVATAVHQGFGGDLTGWELVKGWGFRYSAEKRPWLRVFRRSAKAGETLVLPQGSWTGSLLVAPQITVVKSKVAPHDPVPGVVIDYRAAHTRSYIGCPSVAILAPNRYVASHSFFGPGSDRGRSRVFGSGDGGKTWRQLAEVPHLSFSTLFVHREALYVMGVYRGHVGILRSADGGTTWTEPKDAKSGLLLTDKPPYHSAPVPVLEHRGRLWRAMEDRQAGGKWPYQFRAFMMSAPVDADLLAAASWTDRKSVV